MKSIIPVGVVPNILVPLCERIIFFVWLWIFTVPLTAVLFLEDSLCMLLFTSSIGDCIQYMF